MRFSLASVLLALLCTACAGEATSPNVDAGRSDGSDAGPPSLHYGPSSAPCTNPLVAALPFTSLSALPVAALCADSSAQNQAPRSADVTEVQCGPWVIVVEWTMLPTASFWIFDATTGALASVGAMVEGQSWCVNGPPGYQLPRECFDPDPARGRNLCASLDGGEVGDAGVEAGATDASGG